MVRAGLGGSSCRDGLCSFLGVWVSWARMSFHGSVGRGISAPARCPKHRSLRDSTFEPPVPPSGVGPVQLRRELHSAGDHLRKPFGETLFNNNKEGGIQDWNGVNPPNHSIPNLSVRGNPLGERNRRSVGIHFTQRWSHRRSELHSSDERIADSRWICGAWA